MVKLAFLVALVSAGCLKSGQFQCANDGECDRVGAGGMCQSTGFCSFADAMCESGQRYSNLSGSMSNRCVGDPGSSDGVPDGPTDTSGDTPPGTYTIGGTISGLTGSVTLQKNGGDPLTRTTNGMFTFSQPLADGSDYIVSVTAQPAGQTCLASGNLGTVMGADVTSIAITCGAQSSARILCDTGLECMVGTEYCCFTQATVDGTCNTQNQCNGKHVDCDSKTDCSSGNICCAMYSNAGSFRNAQCQTEMFCIPSGGVVVEIWCDPADGINACPLGKTCTGTPTTGNPGWHTCI